MTTATCKTTDPTTCPKCHSERFRMHGRDRYGHQRFRCRDCLATFQGPNGNVLGRMLLPVPMAASVLHHLMEGASIRSTERLTGINRNTILSLLETAGRNCLRFWGATMQRLTVADVQADEIWDFIYCKQRTKERMKFGDDRGDAWTFTAIDRETKLLVCWHLGKRTEEDAFEFARKLNVATSGRFQLTTDGLPAYQTAIPLWLKGRIDFAQLVKIYGKPSEDDQRRYSPSVVIGTKKKVRCGNPNRERICTSHIERENLTMRMSLRRFTRLTNAHSKKWANHEYALAVFFCWYNFCRKHLSLKGKTPAMVAGLTDHVWTIEELLLRASQAAG